MISALFALSLSWAPAPVYVEVAPGADDHETRSLHDQLMLRLLEEGYPLAPSADHATRTLRVESTPGGIRVQAEGEDVHGFEIATGPVLPLEAVHRAMQALDEVTPRAEPSQPPPPRYAVYVHDAPPETSPEEVRRELVHELLARHAAVVPLDATPDAVVCAESIGSELALSRGNDVGDCGMQPTIVTLRDAKIDPTALDRSLDGLMEEPESFDLEPIVEAPRVRVAPGPRAGLAVDRDATPDRDGPAVRLGVRTGVYGRMSAADAAIGTTLRVGGEPGPGGLLDVLLMPSSAPDISILETSISGGFGWMWVVHPVVALHVQGLGGVQLHRFRQRGAETGHRVDWTAEIPLGASLRLARGLRLDLAVRGGRSGRAREHRVDDVVVWERTAWRIGGTIGLSYGWRPR